MVPFTVFLTFVSHTAPALEELSQRTESWIREDVTITSVSEFHTSEFLREGERLRLLHHVFLDDENETLRTVVCTDTRVIVLEEGVVVREIALNVKPVLSVSSPSGRYLVFHGGPDIPEDVRAVRLDTATGDQRRFNAMPSDDARTGTWTWLQDDGSLVTRLGSYLWFFDTELNPVMELSVAATGTDVSVAGNADIVFITAPTLSAYSRRGDLLWTISDKYDRVRVHNTSISDDGSLVGLAMRDGAFLFDGATGALVRELPVGNTGAILFSPSSNRFLLNYRDEEGISKYTFVEAATGVTQTVGRCAVPNPSNPSPGARSVCDNGMVLFSDVRSFSCIVADESLTPVYYYYGHQVKPYPAALSSSGGRLVHAVEPVDSFPSFMLLEMERGN